MPFIAPIAVLIALWPPAAPAADGMRCEGGLIDRGDGPAEVRAACGEPDYSDRWEQRGGPPYHAIPDVETWVYNPGPGRLVSILRFRNGRLLGVDSDGYGFAVPGPRDCSPNSIVTGMSKYRLLEACGEPVQRDSVILYRPLGRHRPGLFAPLRREKWLYDFGKRRLRREVVIENGYVTDVVVGERGYGGSSE